MSPNFTSMSTPSTRAEFEVRMHLLQEQLQQGKMHFSSGLRGPESLLNVRYLPNRRIDLLSIDEMTRLNANMTHQMHTTDMAEMFKADKDESER